MRKLLVLFLLTAAAALAQITTYPYANYATWSSFMPNNYASGVFSVGQFTPQRAITIDRYELFIGTTQASCTTNAVISIVDGSNSNSIVTSLTLANAIQIYDSGATSLGLAFPAGHILRLRVTTSGVGCSPGASNGIATIQYH
jgi:hypothetical protein